MKRTRIGSTIDIWPEELINNKYIRDAKCIYAEIIQIEHAYDDKFIVEYINKEEKK